MNDRPMPGWIYVLTHPAWEGLGMVKIGRTGRNPRTRAAEITSVSGLLAPCKIAFCSPVSDMAGAELAVHRMLAPHRAVIGSQPPPGYTFFGVPLASAGGEAGREWVPALAWPRPLKPIRAQVL